MLVFSGGGKMNLTKFLGKNLRKEDNRWRRQVLQAIALGHWQISRLGMEL